MITYEIKKKLSIPENVANKVQHILGMRRPPQQQQQRQTLSLPHVVAPHKGTDTDRYMGKLEFAQWIEDLKKEIKRGDYMTLASMNYRPGATPFPLFKVVDIQEIHWNAPIGIVHNQPRAVLSESVNSPGIICAYEPKLLRKLNEEELKLVNSPDTQGDHTEIDLAPDLSKGETLSFDTFNNKWVIRDKDGAIKKYTPTQS